ncbi:MULTISPECIES: hypothetical protein [Hyphomonas]|jgi:hypothetical protein|uniref:Uncharacterized protein n=2 Tax=Hyphomonas atlantica TaxID=1280948 RepID=A0A059DYH9_9PROT|nr:hypothetical protein [Hyphomonas atlantica]KCZ58559.1 hypothetical protein HY36_09280 [Hyphomonas atlantica]|tara:strand:- start:233 stop:463 length:231 start_codon:yes stop_codon:yes gene_type:complete
MDPILMVVLIVLISVGAGVVNNYLKLKANSASDIASDADFQKVLGEVDRLKERVRVLEKIVTDQERQLSEEIRKLA